MSNKYPWVVVSIWCSTQWTRRDFDNEAAARHYAAERQRESRDRVIIIEPGGYLSEVKGFTP